MYCCIPCHMPGGGGRLPGVGCNMRTGVPLQAGLPGTSRWQQNLKLSLAVHFASSIFKCISYMFLYIS